MIHSLRSSGDDIGLLYKRSPDLENYIPFFEGLDYQILSLIPVVPGRNEVSIELFFDSDEDPRMFYVREFFENP